MIHNHGLCLIKEDNRERCSSITLTLSLNHKRTYYLELSNLKVIKLTFAGPIDASNLKMEM